MPEPCACQEPFIRIVSNVMSISEKAKKILRRIGAAPDDPFSLGEAALALATLDRPRVPLDRYHRHLDELGDDIGRTGAGNDGPDGKLAALNDVLWNLLGAAVGCLGGIVLSKYVDRWLRRGQGLQLVPLAFLGCWAALRLNPFVPSNDFQAITRRRSAPNTTIAPAPSKGRSSGSAW